MPCLRGLLVLLMTVSFSLCSVIPQCKWIDQEEWVLEECKEFLAVDDTPADLSKVGEETAILGDAKEDKANRCGGCGCGCNCGCGCGGGSGGGGSYDYYTDDYYGDYDYYGEGDRKKGVKGKGNKGAGRGGKKGGRGGGGGGGGKGRGKGKAAGGRGGKAGGGKGKGAGKGKKRCNCQGGKGKGGGKKRTTAALQSAGPNVMMDNLCFLKCTMEKRELVDSEGQFVAQKLEEYINSCRGNANMTVDLQCLKGLTLGGKEDNCAEYQPLTKCVNNDDA